jgi:hypothetical protein
VLCKPAAAALAASDEALDAVIRFEADDASFSFALPSGWVGVTGPEQERASASHLIAVSAATTVARARRLGGAAVARAVVDGGARGRAYGSSVLQLGSLQGVASKLVSDELLNDAAAKSAVLLSTELLASDAGRPSYYVVRYLVDLKVPTLPATLQRANAPAAIRPVCRVGSP